MILILICCDHLPTSANVVIEVPNPGTNCGNLEVFKPDSFDFVVSTLALFGGGDSWKATLTRTRFDQTLFDEEICTMRNRILRTNDQYSVFHHDSKRKFLYI